MAKGEQVRKNGWRQGAFLPSELVLRLGSELGCKEATHAVVISQDCDVTCDDLEVEPYAEILMLEPLDTINPGLVDGKSSRILHLEVLEGSDRRCFQARPWSQRRIDREILASESPDSSCVIPLGSLRGLIQWVAERYTRAGFPDEFVKRIEAIDSKLKKLMKKEGKAFWRILVSLDSNEELKAGSDYGMDCVCAVWPEVWEDDSDREKAKAAADKLKKLLESCGGIELDEFEVNTTDELPLSYLQSYRTWDVFNYLTHRDLLEKDSK